MDKLSDHEIRKYICEYYQENNDFPSHSNVATKFGVSKGTSVYHRTIVKQGLGDKQKKPQMSFSHDTQKYIYKHYLQADTFPSHNNVAQQFRVSIGTAKYHRKAVKQAIGFTDNSEE